MRLILISVIVFTLIASFCFAQNGYIFNYDFNGNQVGTIPSGWKATAEGKVEVANFPSSANKSVKITDTGNGGGMTLLFDKPLTGKTVTMEFKFYREKGWTAACEIFYVMNKKCPDDWSGICIKDNDDGTMAYHNGAAWINSLPLEDGVWHDFKVVLYLDKDKYDLYYDGKEIAKNVGYRKWDGLAGQGIDKFNVANVGDGGSTFVKYFDDIMLYDGTTRPVITSVSPVKKLTAKWGEIKLSSTESSIREYPAGHIGTRFEKGLLPKAYTQFSRLSN